MITLNKFVKRCFEHSCSRGDINTYTSPMGLLMIVSKLWRSTCEKNKNPELQKKEAAKLILWMLMLLYKLTGEDVESVIKECIEDHCK